MSTDYDGSVKSPITAVSDSPTKYGTICSPASDEEISFVGFKKTPIVSDSLTKYGTICSPGTDEEISFVGFKKTPIVLVTRFDITPYMKKQSRNLISFNSTKKSLGLDFSSTSLRGYDRLLRKCTVKLLRLDLKTLKDSLNNHINNTNHDHDCSLNMENLKCKICEKVYTNEKRLLTHQKNKHEIIYKSSNKKSLKRVSFSDHIIVHELKEYHKCRKCTRIFDNYKTLKSHMKETHKKRTCYICNYCSKMFLDRMFFKVHIKLHCDICGQLFKNRKEIQAHRDHKCGTDKFKMHKCKECDYSFFKSTDLQDHSHEHFGMNFICNKCNDKFNTKCALAHHISFLHIKKKKRPKSLYGMRNLGSERLYLCNFCDESSVEREVIEKHVEKLPDLTNKVIRGHKDYYFCDECLLKFNTEKEMMSHKWTHYLKTSDNSQNKENLLKNKRKRNIIETPFNTNEIVPDYMRPKVVLEYIDVGENLLKDRGIVGIKSFDVQNSDLKKPIVDKKSKKTLISKYKCQTCEKYYCSNHSLNRHIESMHSDYENFKCKVCEETFVWPSLLKTHKCIRLHTTEMPFDDARPEIHFDNFEEITPNGFDDLSIECEDYTQVDFEIPEPIVELEECHMSIGNVPVSNTKYFTTPQGVDYRIVQELPIEF